MIPVTAGTKLGAGVAAVLMDLVVVTQVAQGPTQPVLGPWGQAGVFVAGLGMGAAAVAWTLKSLRELRAPANGTGEGSAERRTAAAVRQVIEEIAETRHELRNQMQAMHLELARLEKELGQEFRVLERRLHEGGRP